MSNETKQNFLNELRDRFGELHKLEGSLSLFDVGKGAERIYIRYSKIHARKSAFFGLRIDDLRKLEGRASAICFLWEGQTQPLIVPFSSYEEVFHSLDPARDGQYKVQVYPQPSGTELYIAGAGRFNVEAWFGWQELEHLLDQSRLGPPVELSHSQVQTLLGSIGATKGYHIWIPDNDRGRLDWTVASKFDFGLSVPPAFETIRDVFSEIDVMWLERGSMNLRALFEVEHTTPIYSALLRFNDLHLSFPSGTATYNVVARDDRRSLFVRQLKRPTFRVSKLNEYCTFLEYSEVLAWHRRTVSLAS